MTTATWARRIVVLGLSAALVGIAAGAAANNLWDEPNPDPDFVLVEPPTDAVGLGEDLILVIGRITDDVAAAQGASTDLSLGHVDGFHTDAADNYEIAAAYVATSPYLHEIPCDQFPGIHDACAAGAEFALEPVRDLTRVPLPDLLPTLATLAATCVADESPKLPTCPGRGLAEFLERLDSVTSVRLQQKHFTLTAFRTKVGAEEFVDMVRAILGPDVANDLLVVQARRVAGDRPIGLGQEAHPDGSGPLYDELADQASYQG